MSRCRMTWSSRSRWTSRRAVSEKSTTSWSHASCHQSLSTRTPAFNLPGRVSIFCDAFSPLRYLSIVACLHAHCQTREQFERWAQQQCIGVDSCAAFLASQGLSERLVQLRLQYDVSVPSVAHFALTLKENAENLRKFSLAVDRCRDAGFVHDDDQETYDTLFGSSLKRIALSAAPPSVMAASLIAMIGPHSERDMLR